MIKNPIPQASEELQSRAIGIIYGNYKPNSSDSLNKGIITDENEFVLDTVVLGKALPLLKKYIDFENKYYWIVYPRNKNSNLLHLQIAGVWDPNNFKKIDSTRLKKSHDLLNSLHLRDNLFSIRGKLIFINTSQKELIVKISPSQINKSLKNKSFKIFLKGEIPMSAINSFVSLEVTRKNNTLYTDEFEIITPKSSDLD